MKLKLRLVWLIIASFFRKRVSVLEENVLNLRVLPNDIDFVRISNDRYFALMDLGRFDITFRGGLLSTFIKKRWFPMARVSTIRFRYPLWLFQKYRLRSRVIYWDSEWIWTEHHFERKNRIIATGIVKVAMIGPGGIVPISEVAAAAGVSPTPPPVPSIVADLSSIEEQIKTMQH